MTRSSTVTPEPTGVYSTSRTISPPSRGTAARATRPRTREREAPRRAAGGREKPAARPPRAATPRRAPADAEAPIACSRPLVHAGAERARGERDAIARRDDAAVV